MNLIRKLSVAALLAVPFLSHATNFSLKVNAIGADGKAQLVDYKPLDKASKDWSICVSLGAYVQTMTIGVILILAMALARR